MPLKGESARQAAVGRVTGGIPSLCPAQRAAQALIEDRRREVDEAVADATAKEAKLSEVEEGRAVNDFEAQMGRTLSFAELKKLLLQCNPNLLFEVSNARPDRMGVYYRDNISNLEDPNPRYRGVRFLMGMEANLSPEFTVRPTKQADGTYTGMAMGWRDVLQRLMKLGFVTEAQVFRVFGPPSRPSKGWQLITA